MAKTALQRTSAHRTRSSARRTGASSTRVGKAPAVRPSRRPAAGSERVEVRNVNVPGYRASVDAAKYLEVKRALLAVLPRTGPGMTQKD